MILFLKYGASEYFRKTSHPIQKYRCCWQLKIILKATEGLNFYQSLSGCYCPLEFIISKGVAMPGRAGMYLPDYPCHIVQRGNNREACFIEPENYLF